MSELVCATNFSDLLPKNQRAKRCVMRGQHQLTCLDDDCEGCLPRRAEVGYLCQHCYEKLDEALRQTVALIEHLRSATIGKAPSTDRVSSSMAWTLPGPEEWRAADELMEGLGARPIPSTATLSEARALARDAVAGWGDIQQKVSSAVGAVRGIEYFRRFQTVKARYPSEEAERPLPYLRCRNCGLRSLQRRSPIDYLDDVEVVCPACKHRHDWWEFLDDSADVVQAVIAAQRSAEAEAKRKKRIAK